MNRLIRASLLMRRRAATEDYANAAGRSSAARQPRAQSYCAGRDGGAIAPTERAGAVERKRLVPRMADESAPGNSPIFGAR